MFSLHKKTIAIVVLTILAIIYMVPVFAQTATSDVCADKDNTMCWPQKMCQDKGGNFATTADSKKVCGAIADCYKKNYPKMSQEALNNYNSLGYCYTKPAAVNLQIPIGELKQSATFTQYIPAVYNYLVAIVSIVAIVMIMVGGLQYLTAGGNPSAITSAKERILGAVIGLFLTFGSYILLQTINPALVQLKMPDIKMVRTSALQQEGIVCPSDSPNKTGKFARTTCDSDCDCVKGETCTEVQDDFITYASKITVWGATAVAGGAVVGGANVAAGAKYIVKGSVDAIKYLAPKLGKAVLYFHDEIIAGTGAYLLLNSLGAFDSSGTSGTKPKAVKNGMCLKIAKNSIPAGGLCAFNSNCISGKCWELGTKNELTEEAIKANRIGVCIGDSKVFEGKLACKEDSTCTANAGANPKLRCVGGFCSLGEENHSCCANGEIDNTPQFCDKGFNKCESDLSCGFYYAGNLYKTNEEYFIDTADPGLITTLKDTLKNSGGKCTKDCTKENDPSCSWAPDALYGEPQ